MLILKKLWKNENIKKWLLNIIINTYSKQYKNNTAKILLSYQHNANTTNKQ